MKSTRKLSSPNALRCPERVAAGVEHLQNVLREESPVDTPRSRPPAAPGRIIKPVSDRIVTTSSRRVHPHMNGPRSGTPSMRIWASTMLNGMYWTSSRSSRPGKRCRRKPYPSDEARGPWRTVCWKRLGVRVAARPCVRTEHPFAVRQATPYKGGRACACLSAAQRRRSRPQGGGTRPPAETQRGRSAHSKVLEMEKSEPHATRG